MADENKKSEAGKREEKILEFWRANKIFEKSLEQTKKGKEFVYYDGPVTANSKPVLHTMVPFSFKDAIPRYRTMQGYHVRRKGGWDTHGLPVELQVEKKLGLNSKKAIEEYGIAKFNRDCRESVWEYVGLWKTFTERIGYWADQENPYVTYHNPYIESVWNVVAEADKQNLLYKDYKIVPWCPRCGTALSSHELAQGYEEVKDLSVYAKFRITSPDTFAREYPASLRHHSQKHAGEVYFLAWTTTPWTLPGNIALAVGADVVYVEAKVGEETYVLAKDRVSILPEGYQIIAEHKGSEVVGMEYEPIFPFLKEQLEKKGEKVNKCFKVYTANFVNTEDGTGIVHTAVMYGQDDFELGTKIGLPKHHLVSLEGKFVSGTGFLENRFVRDEETAVEIIKDLAHRNLLFKKEKYTHSYPHCWRCKTALIYYARDSWYIKVSDPKIKDKLISENKKIAWEPEHTREGRFGEWLREIKDWAVSRERYWGTPLPVWVAEDGDKIVVDSIATLKKYSQKSGNKYFVMRHGEAENNVAKIVSVNQNKNHLTEDGKKQAKNSGEKLKGKKITQIYCSPFLRAKETAAIVADELGFPNDQIIFDDRLRELGFGDLSEHHVDEYWKFIKDKARKFTDKMPNGESLEDAKNRFGNFLYEIDKKHKGENILIVSHGIATEMLPMVIRSLSEGESMDFYNHNAAYVKTGGFFQEEDFVPLPHNENYELDLHRPYIDEIVLEKDGKKFTRTKEVMDVWLDSGCMPFAQDHYPFENKSWVEGSGYPADYISEAIDQTRGWFYTLHAVGVIMGRGRAYKNVICLGHLLDANGKKMSKSLGNIVDPWEMMEKYGVDTLRLWMYSVNQPGESKNFDEKTVALLHQQVFGLLYNVLAFYELYPVSATEHATEQKSSNVLDKWILARLEELIKLSTESMDNYKLLEPTRAIKDFIGDLSTWYLRRSRDRIKEGGNDARVTLLFVLKNLAKVLAPFAPFAAEDIWLRLRNAKDPESVHLAKWPAKNIMGKIKLIFSQGKLKKIVVDMSKVRGVVSLGLEARQKAKIQVRQPLPRLELDKGNLIPGYYELVKDELNVKEVAPGKEFKLITELTPELKEEGIYRELLRAIQDLRKKRGLTPSDTITLSFQTNEDGRKLVQKFEKDMKKVVSASKIEFKDLEGESIKIDNLDFKIKIEK